MTGKTGVAVVTGASRGIGLAMVRQLFCLPEVTHVYACSRNASASEALLELAEQQGERMSLLDVDLLLEEDIAGLAGRVAEYDAQVHWLINCAGVLHDAAQQLRPEKRIEDIDSLRLQKLFQLNAFAPILLARYFLPLLRHDRPATFASLSARVGSISDNQLGGWYGYRASKAAQNQFLRTFAIEARRRAPRLTVLALHPGTTDTGLSAPFQANVPAEKLFTPAFAAQQLLQIILGCEVEHSGRFYAWDGREIPW